MNGFRTCKACAGEGAAVDCVTCMGEGTEPAPARYRVRIVADNDAHSDPRDCDNLGTMYCAHRRYTLGDEDADDPRDSETGELREDIAVSLPLYLYDHSGITMSCGPFSCPWDSGQVGIIYVTRERLLAEYGGKRVTKKMRETAEKVLRGEVEVYDYFITGQVYGFILEKGYEGDDGEVDEWEHEDSCFGFLGPIEENGILDHLAPEFHELARNAEVEYS